ncbi:MAG: hypothetical protein M0C28_03570 [Candidatus Moduliflexus flocculans]|nr:hypothetical protein [Candidatus Moduliflexus flocculans]
MLAGLLAMPAQAASGADLNARRCVAVVLDLGSVSFGESGFGSGLRYGGGAFFRTGKHAGVEIVVERFDVPVAAGTAATDEWTAGLGAGRMDNDRAPHQPALVHPEPRPDPPLCPHGDRFLVHRLRPRRASPDGIERDFVDRIALQLGAGLDYRLTSRLAACAKVRGNLAKTWVENCPGRRPSATPIRSPRTCSSSTASSCPSASSSPSELENSIVPSIRARGSGRGCASTASAAAPLPQS